MKNAALFSLTLASLIGTDMFLDATVAEARLDQNTRVLVIGEDIATNQSRRSKATQQKVSNTLKQWLDSNGYSVLQQRSTPNRRLGAKKIIKAAQNMQQQDVDALVIYDIDHDVKRHRDGTKSLEVTLTSKLVNLPSGKVIDTVSVTGVEQNTLPNHCKVICRERHAFDVIKQIAPAFAEDTVTQLMQTNWRTKPAKWQEPEDEPGKVYGYSVVLQDFRPSEIKRIMRVFHRHADQVDVWTVREDRDSRTLWIEAEKRPAKIRKALVKLLQATNLDAHIRRTERGFTVTKESQNITITRNNV